MGPLVGALLSVAVAIAAFVGIFTVVNLAVDRLPPRWERRVRPWVFVGPALLFLFIGLFMPAVRTVYLSFRGGNRGDDGFTLDNWFRDSAPFGVLRKKAGVVNFDHVGHIFTSPLFIVGVTFAVLAGFAGWLSARRSGDRRSIDVANPWSSIGLIIAVIAVLFAVFVTLRGILWNNLWWVVAVTGLTTAFGLGLAVLADRSRSETAAKTLIF